jgi:hypothetical protein
MFYLLPILQTLFIIQMPRIFVATDVVKSEEIMTTILLMFVSAPVLPSSQILQHFLKYILKISNDGSPLNFKPY